MDTIVDIKDDVNRWENDDLMTKILMNIEDSKKTMMMLNQRLEYNAQKIEILKKQREKNEAQQYESNEKFNDQIIAGSKLIGAENDLKEFIQSEIRENTQENKLIFLGLFYNENENVLSTFYKMVCKKLDIPHEPMLSMNLKGIDDRRQSRQFIIRFFDKGKREEIKSALVINFGSTISINDNMI